MTERLASRTVLAAAAGTALEALALPVTDVPQVPFRGLWRDGVRARIVYGRVREWLGF